MDSMMDDDDVEMHHHCLWQVELHQLPQDVCPLLFYFGVQFPL